MRDKRKADAEPEGEPHPRAAETTDGDDALPAAAGPTATADIGLQPLPASNHGGFPDPSAQSPPGDPGAFPPKKTPSSFALVRAVLGSSLTPEFDFLYFVADFMADGDCRRRRDLAGASTGDVGDYARSRPPTRRLFPVRWR